MFVVSTGPGPFFANVLRRAIFRGVTTGSFAAAAVGQVLAFDMALQSADTTSGYLPHRGHQQGQLRRGHHRPGRRVHSSR